MLRLILNIYFNKNPWAAYITEDDHNLCKAYVIEDDQNLCVSYMGSGDCSAATRWTVAREVAGSNPTHGRN